MVRYTLIVFVLAAFVIFGQAKLQSSLSNTVETRFAGPAEARAVITRTKIVPTRIHPRRQATRTPAGAPQERPRRTPIIWIQR